jgi:hypothetical protein
MNRFLKTFLLISALALGYSAKAQDAKFFTLGSYSEGGTNRISALATNSPTDTFACSDFDQVGIQVSAVASNTMTGNITFRFKETLNSSTYETTAKHVVLLTLTSTNTATTVTNLPVASAAGLQLSSIESTNGSTVTNIAVGFRFKQPKRKAQ